MLEIGKIPPAAHWNSKQNIQLKQIFAIMLKQAELATAPVDVYLFHVLHSRQMTVQPMLGRGPLMHWPTHATADTYVRGRHQPASGHCSCWWSQRDCLRFHSVSHPHVSLLPFHSCFPRLPLWPLTPSYRAVGVERDLGEWISSVSELFQTIFWHKIFCHYFTQYHIKIK